MINWNMKCVIAGIAVIMVYLAGTYSLGPSIDFKADPILSAGWLALLFVLWYVLGAYLDSKFGCEHGTFYRDVLGW